MTLNFKKFNFNYLKCFWLFIWDGIIKIGESMCHVSIGSLVHIINLCGTQQTCQQKLTGGAANANGL